LREIIWVDGLEWKSKFRMQYADAFFEDKLKFVQFDTLAGAVQQLTEELICKWVRDSIRVVSLGFGKKIDSIGLAGGVFMNVRAVQKVSELPEVRSMFITPSAGDESTVIGGCFAAQHALNQEIEPIKDLYLGQEFDNKYIENYIQEAKLDEKYKIKKCKDINLEVAKLLSTGEIIARCSGRSEFGARALGNRSILANPAHHDTIRLLNETIKDRCYDKETEILTLEGWKYLKDLKKDEIVATLNPDKNTLEYQKIVEKIVQNYSGPMKHIHNKRIDLMVSPNHKLWMTREKYNKGDKKKFKFELAKDVNKQHIQLKGGVDWVGKNEKYFYLPGIKKAKHGHNKDCDKIKKIPMHLWLEFLGYWLTEGHTTDDGHGHYRVTISQSENGRAVNEIRNCLKRMSYVITTTKCTNCLQFTIQNKQLYSYLAQLGKSSQKYIPREILSLSKSRLRILFDAMIRGDGHIRNNQIRYSTVSRRLINDMQELTLKLGYCSSVHCKKREGKNWSDRAMRHDLYSMGIGLSPIASVSTDQITTKRYNGKIYCVTVPKYHLLYVRRKGKPVFSGNSFWMPFTGSVLDKYANKYFHNPKNIFAPYMVITFNSTEETQKRLPTTMHPYDFTVRPQVVTKEYNPDYYDIINKFSKLTGTGGVLNTSFNLHGEPNVLTPEDAIHTVENSSLKYLAMEDYLLEKKEWGHEKKRNKNKQV